MSEKFNVFEGVSTPGIRSSINVPGIMAGDKILQVLCISGPALGNFTGNFDPVAPRGDTIIQESVNLAGSIFLVRWEHEDV
jgi:hypothetical protein